MYNKLRYVQYTLIERRIWDSGMVYKKQVPASAYQVGRSVDICPCLFKEAKRQLCDNASVSVAADIDAAGFDAKTVSSAKGSAS